MKQYKVLVNGKSCHGGNYVYPIGEWTPSVKVKMCSSGYHLTSLPMNWVKVGMSVWEAEGKGKCETQEDKTVYESVRLIKECPELIPDYWKKIESFIESIGSIKWFSNSGVLPEGCQLFETRDAAWEAARDVAINITRDVAINTTRDAAWDAARNTAMNAAAFIAASHAAMNAASLATWDAAFIAAWDAAWDAVMNATWDAAYDTVWDATWYAVLFVHDTLDQKHIDQKHIDHIKKRWAVWEAGYGVLCDINGVLYVYKRLK